MEPNKKKKWMIVAIIVGVLLCCFAALFAIWKFNTFYLDLSITEKEISLEYGVDEMPEVTALCKGTLICRKGIPVKTKMDGKPDLTKLGSYEVKFQATWRGMTLSEKRIFHVVDTLPPSIELVTNPDSFTNPSAAYEEEGFTAIDNYDGDLTSQVIRVEKDGVVTYTVSDSSGNEAKTERKIIYKDAIAPVITLTSGANVSFTIGKDFVDPGYTAVDECDGDITSAVTVEGTVDGRKSGSYTLTYRVSDSSGNVAEIQRIVKVGDFNGPTITLQGQTRMYIKVGETYTEPGFTATDNIDGNITSKVSITGGVDTSKMGINTITYTVTDAAGNTTTTTRSVYVYQKQAVANPVNSGNKVVYLTFDDGPSRHTARLLDILDKYGVKATFFVTNQFSAYKYMIGETHRRGHTIALHTYTHQYSSIYKNENAYYNDLSLIRDLVVQQTGVIPTLVRFPGGTSNTVSRKYCSGIMSSLSQSLSYHGYLYCDWNVSSGDAGGTTSTNQVAANVINGIKKHNVSIVLQHDIYSYSVEAVEQILFWGIQNGYTFLPMSETTPLVQFRPQN